MLAVIIIEFILLGVLCAWLLNKYANYRKLPWYATGSTWLGWLLCFAIVFMLPIDILDTDHDNCMREHGGNEDICDEPITFLPEKVMIVQWSILYWGTFILSWAIFPVLSTFVLAGEFTLHERILRAFKENLVLYAIMAFIGVIAVIALAALGQLKNGLVPVIMGIANAYGLILTVCLMGYGLVDVPRYLFRKASRIATMEHCQAKAYQNKEALNSAKEDLGRTLKTVKKLADKVKEHDPYRIYVDEILLKCPVDFSDVEAEGGDVDLSHAKCVALHEQVIGDVHSMERAACLYEQHLKRAFKLEDVMKTIEERPADKKIKWSFRTPRVYRFAEQMDTLEYYWHVYLYTPCHYALAVCCAILSILIVWCELTLGVQSKDVSPFSHIINAIPLQGIPKQVFCFIPLFYMAFCAYTTLFKIKILNYYRLVPHQMSDANSIMFSANYLCRLAAPLSYNFLSLVHTNDAAFTTVMGDLNAFSKSTPHAGSESGSGDASGASGVGHKFTVFFPIFVAVLCLATLGSVYSKIGSLCCIKKLKYTPEDDFKSVQEGAKLLREEREIREGKRAPEATLKSALMTNFKSITSKFGFGKKDVEMQEKDGADYTKLEEGHSSDGAAANTAPSATSAPSPPPPAPVESAAPKRPTGDDLLPSTSRFAKKPAGSVNNANTTTSGYVNSNNVAFSNTSSSSANTSRFNNNNNNNNNSSASSASSSSSSGHANDDLLPSTSRFAKRAPPTASAAILIDDTPNNMSDAPSGKKGEGKSLLGGFGGMFK